MVEIQGEVASAAFRTENAQRFLSVMLLTPDGELIVNVRPPCLCERTKFWSQGTLISVVGNDSDDGFEVIGVKLHPVEERFRNAHSDTATDQSK